MFIHDEDIVEREAKDWKKVFRDWDIFTHRVYEGGHKTTYTLMESGAVYSHRDGGDGLESCFSVEEFVYDGAESGFDWLGNVIPWPEPWVTGQPSAFEPMHAPQIYELCDLESYRGYDLNAPFFYKL